MSAWVVVVASCLLAGSAPPPVPPPVSINHDPPGCLLAGESSTLAATLQPPETSAQVKVLFRAEGSLYWYTTLMRPEPEGLGATLPRPQAETASVEYVLEAWADGALLASSRIFQVEISTLPTCRSGGQPAPTTRTAAEFYAEAGTPQQPPGFQIGELAGRIARRFTPGTRADSPQASTPSALRPLPGDRVRITVDGKKHIGSLLEYTETAQTLSLRDSGGQIVAVDRSRIERVELSQGRGSRLHNIGFGALFGWVALALVSGVTNDEGLQVDLAIGILGAPGGALVGAMLAPSERWAHAQLPTMPAAPTRPGPRGSVGISVAWRF